MSRRVLKLRLSDTVVTAIAGPPGRIYTPVVYIGPPVRHHAIPNGDVAMYAREIEYSPKKAARTMLRAGRFLGITKAAKTFLRTCK